MYVSIIFLLGGGISSLTFKIAMHKIPSVQNYTSFSSKENNAGDMWSESHWKTVLFTNSQIIMWYKCMFMEWSTTDKLISSKFIHLTLPINFKNDIKWWQISFSLTACKLASLSLTLSLSLPLIFLKSKNKFNQIKLKLYKICRKRFAQCW